MKDLVGTRIFVCEFIKKDGSLRRMRGILGVKKYVKSPKTVDEKRINTLKRKGLVICYDLDKKGYRMINTNTLKYLKCGKVLINKH